MIIIDAATTKDDVIRTAARMRDAGFTVAYVAAKEITEPRKITDLPGAVRAELA